MFRRAITVVSGHGRWFSSSNKVQILFLRLCVCEFRLFLKSTEGLPLWQAQTKVAVLGASGGIGQPMSLLLKQSPLVSKLVLYDIQHTMGVAADLSHVETPAKARYQRHQRNLEATVWRCACHVQVSAYEGPEQLEEALHDCDVVLIPAGVPRKPGWLDLHGASCHLVPLQFLALPVEGCMRCPKFEWPLISVKIWSLALSVKGMVKFMWA